MSKEIKAEDVLFTNEDGTKYCKYKVNDVTFIISFIKLDKYLITFETDDKNPNTKIVGKIFINDGKTMRKNLSASLQENLGLLDIDAKGTVDLLWKEFSGLLGSFVFHASTFNSIIDNEFLRESDSLKLNVDSITFKIMEENHFITFIDSKETYKYKNGVFVQYGDEEIESIVRELLKNHTTNSRINEITSNIKSRTEIDRHSLDMNLNLINVKNGMYEISTGKLLEHSPRYKSIRQLGINYNPDATCPAIEKFMSSIVKPEEIIPLYEAIGYAMIPKTNIKNSTLMLTGSGDNGKSKYLDIVKAFIGDINTSTVSLHDLETDKFALHDLYGKLINVFPDLKSDSIYDNSTFKALTGDDGKIRAQDKMQSAYKFENVARMMFSANKLPPVPDDDMSAFFNRFMVFTFDNVFRGDKADKNIKAKITTDEELSGLFNIVIESLKTVLKNNAFTYNKSISEIENIYRMHSDDIMMFANDKIEEDDLGISVPKSVMYKVYSKWCKDNDVSIKSKNKFTRRLNTLGYIAKSKGSRGEQVLSWLNCKLVSKEDTPLNVEEDKGIAKLKFEAKPDKE